MKVNIGTIQVEIPENYQKIQSLPHDPPDAVTYAAQTESALVLMSLYPIASAKAMPFDTPQIVIDGIHSALGEDQGLIHVSAGQTNAGHKYIYSIVKTGIQPAGVQYVLTFHIQYSETVVSIQAFFEETGTTGLRDTVVYELARRDGKVNGIFDGWMKDPYDPDYTRGLRMNLSEAEEYDSMFPSHPLSVCRRFLEFFRQNN